MPHPIARYKTRRLFARALHHHILLLLLLLSLLLSVSECGAEHGVRGSSAPHSWGDEEPGKRFVEILSVKGCERPRQAGGRSRETHRCFTDKNSKLPVTLSIRGRGFPPHDQLTVRLEEHIPLPLQGNKGNSTHFIVMECADVQASPLFPQQILSCTLLHPSTSLRGKSEWLQRLASHTVWMDLKLLMRGRTGPQKRPPMMMMNKSDPVGEEAVMLGILRRAVQLDLTEGTSAHGIDKVDDTMIVAPDDDPLEDFFSGGHHSFSGGEKWALYGIGGLKNELQTLYRRVFLTRLPSVRRIVDSIQFPLMRGVLLHGPPGNGKTLIARTIAKLLGKSARVTIVNAADILSKYVGDSEKNLRDLIYSGFEDEEVEEGENDYGEGVAEEMRLHVIIIDEIEALFRRRGESNDGSSAKAVYDGLTNQLLTIMDGVEDPMNILIIGLTNRLHVIDHALLRPGRFEVVIEIPPPGFDGRSEMFFIHTRELREKGYLAPDVDMGLLASSTGGFSGADIAGTVRAAISRALVRYHDAVGAKAYLNPSDEGFMDPETTPNEFQVTKDDFTHALRDMLESREKALRGQHLGVDGVADTTAPLVDYDGTISRSTNAMRRMLQSIHQSHTTHAAVVIIYGPRGTGKSVLSQQLVRMWPFDETKFLTGARLHGNSLDEHLEEVVTALRDAISFKGNCSIVIENIEHYFRGGNFAVEDLLKASIHEFKEGSRIRSFSTDKSSGMRFPGKQVLIITTSDKELLHDLLFSVEYDLHLKIYPIQQKRNLLTILQHYGILPSGATASNEVLRAYPEKMSYRQFLRITDLSLWRAHNEAMPENGSSSDQNDTLYSRLNALLLQGGQKRGGVEGAVPAIETERHQQEFSAAVRDVVSEMGLANPLEGLFEMHNGAIEGEEISW